MSQQATHHFWLGCRLVAGFGAELVHGGSRALRTRENWHFVECTCITAPQITCGAPWPWVSFLCGPLRSGKWPGYQGARGCGEPQSQRGSLILYDPGEVLATSSTSRRKKELSKILISENSNRFWEVPWDRFCRINGHIFRDFRNRSSVIRGGPRI